MTIVRRGALAVAVGLAVTGSGVALGEAGHHVRPLGPGVVTVDIAIEHSRFSVERLEVRPGTLLQINLRNGDPIDHELVIGHEDVHASHAAGTEARHPPVPGEVSVRPGATGSTFYRFDEPGTVVFACHLPGHAEYGMTGDVEVVAD